MKVAEAAKRLEISEQLVRRLIAAGRLRCTRHGIGRGTIRVSEEQLAEYVSASEKKPVAMKQTDIRVGVFRHLRTSPRGS